MSTGPAATLTMVQTPAYPSVCAAADPYEAYRALPAWRRWLHFAWLSCLLVFTIGRVLLWRVMRLAWHYAALPGLYASLVLGSSYRRWVSVRLVLCGSYRCWA